ncbi:unnamed protein product [Mycena citricolor]|uniref:Fungal lipase-type domain-containing protein n=1 Tax=Mycena citricolor TaxID=2018698 RepID=A0AAD2Q332_9AGAR|nr:unnamed protein product [Mycena citricolor]
MLVLALLAGLVPGLLQAAPASLDRRDAAPTAVSLSSIRATFSPAAIFARMAYCETTAVAAMNCGTPCDAVDAIGAVVTQLGGDGSATPFYYVAAGKDGVLYVAHEGTDPIHLYAALVRSSFQPLILGCSESVLNDAELELTPANKSFFPAAKAANVHSGFQQTFIRTASAILAAAESAVRGGTTEVVVTGHSLGAALATMTGAYLRSSLPSSVHVRVVGFGMPRSGDQAWADYVDATVPVTFLNNQHDPVPDLPFIDWGYHHSSGEVHITGDPSADFVACPGQDNPSSECSTDNGLDISILNHLGPYFDDISFGTLECAFSL